MHVPTHSYSGQGVPNTNPDWLSRFSLNKAEGVPNTNPDWSSGLFPFRQQTGPPPLTYSSTPEMPPTPKRRVSPQPNIDPTTLNAISNESVDSFIPNWPDIGTTLQGWGNTVRGWMPEGMGWNRQTFNVLSSALDAWSKYKGLGLAERTLENMGEQLRETKRTNLINQTGAVEAFNANRSLQNAFLRSQGRGDEQQALINLDELRRQV